MPAFLNMAPINGTQTISVVRDGQEEKVSLGTNTGPGIVMRETTIANGQIHTTSVLALEWMRTRNLAFKNGAGMSFSFPNEAEAFPPVKVDNIEPVDFYTGSTNIRQLSKTIYQDAYISGNCFKFPESYGIADTIVIPGMCWQDDTQKILGEISSVAWEEKPITIGEKSTAAYPGWSVWESGFISVAGYDQKPLKTNYITNTKKETTNA